MKRIMSFAVLLAALAFVPEPAQAATGCSKADVTVVVQFPDHTAVGCASGDPDTGYHALQKAGFVLTYAQGNGAGALCSIEGYPGHACANMPPANAYWAYFHARPGGSWTFSNEGGGTYDPAPGSVEGWRFGDGSAPSKTAPALAVSTPTPKPTPKQTPKPSSKPSRKPSSKPTAAATPTGTATPTSSPTKAPLPMPATPVPVTPAPSVTPTVSAVAPASKPASSSTEGGLSWIWGPVLLGFLGVAGAATYVARRRG